MSRDFSCPIFFIKLLLLVPIGKPRNDFEFSYNIRGVIRIRDRDEYTGESQLPDDEYTGESRLPCDEYTDESRLPGSEYTGESITNSNNSSNIRKNSKSCLAVFNGTRRSCLMRKTRVKKSRDTVPLRHGKWNNLADLFVFESANGKARAVML